MLLAILLLGIFMKKLNQLYFVAYIVAGVGYIFKIFHGAYTLQQLVNWGLTIQMSFIGEKLEIQSFANHIKKPSIGVAVQLVLIWPLFPLLAYFTLVL